MKEGRSQTKILGRGTGEGGLGLLGGDVVVGTEFPLDEGGRPQEAVLLDI